MRRRYRGALAGLVGAAVAMGTVQPGAADVRSPATLLTYVVRPGDTLSGIAGAYGTTVGDLTATNSLRDVRVVPGETLVVAVTPAGARPGPGHMWYRSDDRAPGRTTPTAMIYVVRPGDTLTGLSLRFGVPVSVLATVNGLPADSQIEIGQRLAIPIGASGGYGAPSPVAPVVPGTSSGTPTPAVPAVAPPTPTPSPVADGTGSTTTPSTATPVAATGAAGESVGALLVAQAQAAGVDPTLVEAVAWQESGWRMVIAADGGIGVMQLMPYTVTWVSTSILGTPINPYNVVDNIHAGVALLRYYLRVFNGNVSLAVAAYHQGLGSVETVGITAEGARYVASVLALQQQFARTTG